jgi:hypothetical protein
MGLNPVIQISFIKSPAFVEANLAQPVANNFLFEAVTRKATILGGFIEIEYTLAAAAAIQSLLQVIRDGARESWQVDEI